MRKHFAHYYQPSEDELEAIWRDAVIALDANVLLNLYRYTISTRNELLSILKATRERLWVPHQAGLEFFRNRLDVMDTQARKFDRVKDDLSKTRRALEELYRSPVKDESSRKAQTDAAWNQLTEYVDASAAEAVAPTADPEKDPVLEELTGLLDERVGDPYTASRQEEVLKEAEERLAKRVPPGYMDSSKPGDAKYGDVILWLQLLDRALELKAPVILVTDDGKEDWWTRVGGRTIGPDPALTAEMRRISGQAFHMYSPARFMQVAARALARTPSDAAIEEVEVLPPIVQTRETLSADRGSSAHLLTYIAGRRSALQAARVRSEEELADIDAHLQDAADDSRDALASRRRRVISQLENHDIELMQLGQLEDDAVAQQAATLGSYYVPGNFTPGTIYQTEGNPLSAIGRNYFVDAPNLYSPKSVIYDPSGRVVSKSPYRYSVSWPTIDTSLLEPHTTVLPTGQSPAQVPKQPTPTKPRTTRRRATK
jgi:PIN like domain